MFEIQLASFALGFVFGMTCLSALICTVVLIAAWRFSISQRGEGETEVPTITS